MFTVTAMKSLALLLCLIGQHVFGVAVAIDVAVPKTCPPVEEPCSCTAGLDSEGCPACMCHEDVPSTACPPVKCNIMGHDCVFARDSSGCSTCTCTPCPPVTCAPGCAPREQEGCATVCSCPEVR
ncbi:unnamed protein product [Ixodes persulcatus]